jgi:hypothetical protein
MENYNYSGFIMAQYGLICNTVTEIHGFHLKRCKYQGFIMN